MTAMTETTSAATIPQMDANSQQVTAYRILGFTEKREPMISVRRPKLYEAIGMDRRRFRRFDLGKGLPARLGRLEAIVVNLSARGARVRHSSFPSSRTLLPLTFQCGNQEISATARVVSSRLISLVSGIPVYESSLALVEVPHISEYLLARFLTRLTSN